MRQVFSIVCAFGVISAAVSLTACESTQDKAKKLQEKGAAEAAAQVPLTIPKPDRSIKVLSTTVLHDEFNDGVAVELKNTGKQTLINVPILVDLLGPGGQSLGKNDAFGLDVDLNHVLVMEPGETVTWVNDQLNPTAPPKSAKVTVGPPERTAPKGPLPQLDIKPPKIENNAAGILAVGQIANKSQTDQLKQPVYVVARSGGKIVAAGRGLIKNLKVGRPSPYKAFFTGDPKGAEVTAIALPSTVQ